jgi:predicted amidophosphoribosyltransferase
MDATTCRLCGADLPEGDGIRCPNCGLHAAHDLDRSGYQTLTAGLAGVYLLTALLVFLTRGR